MPWGEGTYNNKVGNTNPNPPVTKPGKQYKQKPPNLKDNNPPGTQPQDNPWWHQVTPWNDNWASSFMNSNPWLGDFARGGMMGWGVPGLFGAYQPLIGGDPFAGHTIGDVFAGGSPFAGGMGAMGPMGNALTGGIGGMLGGQLFNNLPGHMGSTLGGMLPSMFMSNPLTGGLGLLGMGILNNNWNNWFGGGGNQPQSLPPRALPPQSLPQQPTALPGTSTPRPYTSGSSVRAF
jgi:hypothetical protein